MNQSKIFSTVKEEDMPLLVLSEKLGVSRTTIYRWAVGPLEGMPRIVLLALREGKITFEDIARYRKILMTLKQVISSEPLDGAPAPSLARRPGAYFNAAGRLFYVDSGQVVYRSLEEQHAAGVVARPEELPKFEE